MASKKKTDVEGSDIVSDIFGAGDVGSAIAKGTAAVYVKRTEAEIANEIQRRMVERAQIKAAENIVNVQQKEFTKRHKTIGESVNRWVNESDQILNALDRPQFELRTRRRNKDRRIALSVMGLLALGPMIENLGLKHQNNVMVNTGITYKQWFGKIVDHAHEMNRVASAGEMNFSYPSEESGVTDTPVMSNALTQDEIMALIETAMGTTVYPPEPPAAPEEIPNIALIEAIEALRREIEKKEKKRASLEKGYMGLFTEAGPFLGKKETERLDKYDKEIKRLKERLKLLEQQLEAGT